MSKIDEFKAELKAVLVKYNATISACVGEGSDTHGIYDEHMIIYLSDNKGNSIEGEECRIDDWYVDGYNVEEEE